MLWFERPFLQVLRHEYSGDWDATLETVHPDARYAVAQPGYSKSITGHAGVTDHYRSVEGVVIPHASRLVAQIATDWYMFFDLASASRGELPEDLIADEKILEKLPVLFRSLRGDRVDDDKLNDLIELIRKA